MKNIMKLLLLLMLICTFKAEASFVRLFASKLLSVAERNLDVTATAREVFGVNSRLATRKKIQSHGEKADVKKDEDGKAFSFSFDSRYERALEKIFNVAGKARWNNPFDC